MKNSGTNISLTPYDEILSLDANPIALPFGAIVEIPLAQLHSFKNHPFRVVDDEEMQKTADSIREYGVLMPGIVRPRPDGEYEIISGHRRKRGCEIAGRTTMPVIVRELDDDEATIIMVDSNLQRENILPSERAAAYQMKMEAIRRRAGRPSKENCDQVGHNYSGQRSIDIIAENAPDSRNQIQRFIRLNNLEKPLLQMVDDGNIAFTPAVELSYLKPNEQRMLLETMTAQQSTPSLSQAQRMKRMSQEGTLSHENMTEILSEVKKPPREAAKPAVKVEMPTSSEQAHTAEQAQAKQFIMLPVEPFLKYIPRSYFQEQSPENQEKLTRLFLKMAELYKKYLDKKRAQERG